MSDGGARRIVLSTAPDTYSKLDVLAAGPRFSGNRSKAASWCIELAHAVLTDPSVRDTLFDTPHDALAAFIGGKRRK